MAEEGEKLVLKPGGVTQYLDGLMQTEDCERFFFGELNLSNRRVEGLAKSMDEVKEVRRCDFSINNISDINPLKDMQQLVYLNIARNKVKALTVFTTEEMFPNLRWLDASNNKYTELPALKLPKLEYLDISFNKIEKVNDGWTGHANIRILKSIDNKFKTLAPFKSMPKLEELYLANNAITNLSGWESLPELRKLHLRRNKIEKIEEEMPPLEKLEYLNLRANKIGSMEHVERLYAFATLTDLSVINNPVE
jgi:internalin A